MKKNSSSENSLAEKNYVKRTATDSEHHTEIDLEKYMNELRGIIKAYEEQKHTTNQFTAFKVSQKDISIQETLEMYQSLFEISGNDEKVTVLTIRNNQLAEIDSSEKCIKNIITAAQNLMYEKRNETFLDDLYIQTEVINQNHIQDYDALNKNLRLIEQSKNNFTAYIIDNIFEVIYGSLTQYLFNEIDLALYFNLHVECRCTNLGYNKGKIEFKTTKEDFVKDAYAKILSRVEKFLWFDSVVSTIYEVPPHVQYSVFSLIKSYIVDYEKKSNFSGFSDIDDEAINDIITDTINNYEYIFNKNIKEITPIFLESLQNTDSKGMIDEILEYIHEAMVEYCKINAETEDESLLDHVRKIGRQLETDEKLVSKYQKYCQKIALDPIQFAKLSDIYRAKFDGYVKSLQADNIARIIFGGKLDETKLFHLCNVMMSTNVLNHLCGHQSIYIDLDREMSQDELEASFAKFKARSKDALDLVSKGDLNFTAIQVYTTAKPAQKNVANNAILFLTYKTDTEAVKEQEPCTIDTIRYDLANTTQVKVETYDDQKSCSERLSCISNYDDVSSINNLNIITITNDLETMIVYIVRNMADGMARENISLFYDITKAKKELHTQSDSSGSSIKSVRNAPVTYLKDLVNYIQRKQLTSGKDLVIPNLISLNKIELLYTERTYDQPAENIYRYIDNYFDRLSKGGIEDVAEMYMAKDEIMQSQGFGYFYLNKLMDKLSSEFGIENEKFCKVLYTIMIGRYIRDGSEYWKHQLYLCKSIKNNFILVEPQADGTKALKIFEQNDGADFLSAEIQSAKIFRSILADENNQKLLNFFVYVAKRLNHDNTFISTVINDVYKTKNFNNLHENFINQPDEIRKYVEIYLQYIRDLSRTDNLNSLGDLNNSVKVSSDDSDNHLMIPVEDYPDQAEVEKLVAKTFDEIYYNMNVCEIKMMTIMLTKDVKDQSLKCNAEVKKCCEEKHLGFDKKTDK